MKIHLISSYQYLFFYFFFFFFYLSLGSLHLRALSNLLIIAGFGMAFPDSYILTTRAFSFIILASSFYDNFAAHLAFCRAILKSKETFLSFHKWIIYKLITCIAVFILKNTVHFLTCFVFFSVNWILLKNLHFLTLTTFFPF